MNGNRGLSTTTTGTITIGRTITISGTIAISGAITMGRSPTITIGNGNVVESTQHGATLWTDLV